MGLTWIGAGFWVEIEKFGIIANTVIKYSNFVNANQQITPNEAATNLEALTDFGVQPRVSLSTWRRDEHY